MTPELQAAYDSVKGQAQFNWMSWLVIVAYVLFTTWIGHKLAGKQATIRDFFLGGRRLPWYAVSGSIIATEISAMTLVSVPAFLWSKNGCMTYAVLGIGNILGRVITAIFFIPKYYEEEIYSPYEYIGQQLGNRAYRITSLLFMAGGMLGQGVRVLLTAVVLQAVTGMSIYTSIWVVGAVAVLWTLIGGIVTVIWTDVVQFVIFFVSVIVALIVVITQFPVAEGQSAIGEIARLASEAGKFRIFDFSFDIRKDYTLWTGLIAATIGGLAAYGTDQMMVQRAFCCRDPRQARKAMLWSSVGQSIMVLCLLMGVGMWAFYQKSGLPNVPNAVEALKIAEKRDNMVPMFIQFRMHWFWGGLVVAGIFAAAISSVEGILAALAQQTLAWTRRFGAGNTGGAAEVRLSRIYVFIWAIVLCAMASIFQAMASKAKLLVELALTVVGFTAGSIIGLWLMALIPRWRRDGKGLEWTAAISVMSVVAVARHGETATFLILLGVSLLILLWSLIRRDTFKPLGFLRLLPFVAFVLFLNKYSWTDAEGTVQYIRMGWPWYTPFGLIVMLAATLFACRPKPLNSAGR